MAKTITQYSILISCPSDVLNELSIINQVIDDFNKTIGEANNINLAVKHWLTHTYPESGGKPQELINKQIVLDCDAAIAVFWTKFGTPTDSYGSGTEEEIELLLKEDKQVFLYFSNVPVPPNEYDSEQYTRVQEFRNGYKEKGIYSEYDGLEEFKQNFTNHLNFHFFKIISENISSLTPNKTPNLNVRGIDNDALTEKTQLIQPNLRESQFIKSIELEIKELFKSIKAIYIPIEVEKDIDNTIQNNSGLIVSDSLKRLGEIAVDLNEKSKKIQGLFDEREIDIQEVDRKLIKNYADNEGITLDEAAFFNIGNLTEFKNLLGGGPLGTGPSYDLSGSDEEKEKYKLIDKLINKIGNLNQWMIFFGEIDSKYYIRLAIANNGTTFDEDVDVKLFIKKGELVKKDEIPFPEDRILEAATELLERIYKIPKTSNIEEYVGNEINRKSYIPSVSYLGMTFRESIETLQENYNDGINDIFIYDYFQDNEFDIINFNISYIKHHTNIAFPTLLVLHSEVKEIKYEINSKHSSEVIEGTLSLNKAK